MSKEGDKKWFYMALGHRRGPVAFEDLREKIVKKEVVIESTQVWKQGMKQWINLADAKPFATTIKKITSVSTQADSINKAAATNDVDEDLICRGASRLLFNLYFYIGWLIPIVLAVVVLTELQVQQILSPVQVSSGLFFKWLPFILLAIATWQMAASRMRHAGYSRAQGLGVFLPLYNLWVFMVCLLTPRNYKRKKKLGAVVIIYLLMFGGVVAGCILVLVPKVGAQNLSPFVMTEKMTEYYKGKTSYSSRYNDNVSEAARAKARKEQLLKEKKEEREQSKGSLGLRNK